MNYLRHPLFYLVTLLVSVFSGLQAAPFAPGNIVVYRVGDGTGSLLNTGNPVFLDEYSPTGTLVQSVAMPTTVSGLNKRLVASGTASSEGLLSRSADGRFLIAAGYDVTPPHTASLTSSTSLAVSRVIARVSASGAVDTTTALTDAATGNNPRSVASADGTGLWITGGAGGVRYTTFGATTSNQLSTTLTNLRQVNIFDGQLYISTSSGSAVRIGAVGTGLPTAAGEVITNLPGIPTTGSPYAFFFADLDSGVAGVDTLYVADDANTVGTGGVRKFSLVGGTWTANGIAGLESDAYRGLTGSVTGGTVTLFAARKGGTAATGGGEIVSLVDAAGYNATIIATPTLLATAAANTSFRGVALAPFEIETPNLLLTEINSNAAGGDFWELTNVGTMTQDIGGWKWIDAAQSLPAPAAQIFPTGTMIDPGESIVIITDTTDPTAFLAAWGPLTGVQRIVGGPGLGQNDSVRLYDGSDNLYFTFSYASAGFIRSDSSPAAGGHAGLSAGGAAQQSAVIDPVFGTDASRRYMAATAGVNGAYANTSGGVNIGSPGATGLIFGGGPSITLTLGATPTSFSESATNPASVGTVTRSGATTAALEVTLSSSDTTEATVPATVTIGIGQASADFNITAINDTFPDGNKSVTLTATATGATPGTTVVTVQDDGDTLDTDFLLTEVQSSQSAGKPSTANDYWELTNVGSNSRDITGYSWHDSGRSASSAQAYKLPSGTTIAAGESIIFTAMPAADFRAWWNLAPSVQVFQSIGAPGLGQGDGISFFDAEQNELFFFDYAAPAVGPPVRLGFLREDGSPSTGGHAGPSAGGSAESQSLIWVPSSGTVSPRYTAATGSNLGTFSAVAPATDLGSPGLGNVRTVSLSNNSVLEGNSGTTVLPLTVTRSDTATAFTVDYAVTGGTATSGTDYAVLASGTLTFTNGGAATQTINLSVNGDTAPEPDETIVVTLSNVVNTLGNTLVGTATGTGTILNDDIIAPSLTLKVGGSTIATGGVTSLRVAVSGNPAPTIQWYQGIKGDTSTPVGIPNSPTLLTTALSGSTNFWVRASNTGGDFDSDTVAVNVVAPVTSVDLSNYVRVGRYSLPEPLLTALPAGTPAHNLLCQEASGVTYNWDTDTLFVVADGGRSVTQVSKTGVLIDTMTLALGTSPQGTTFYDIEGVTYIGGGEFVMAEERDRQLVKFTYAAGTTLTRAQTQTVKIGTFVDNTGTEGLSYDPFSGGYVLLKEISPIGIFQSSVDFVAGTASNGSAATVNSTDLFDPALLGMRDVADVFALSVLPSMTGQPQEANLIVLSQEDGKLVNIDRNGVISSTRQLFSDPGNPLSVAGQQHEGVTMDPAGFLYIVNENGGGGIDFPELWVYAPATAPNAAPTGLSLNGAVTSVIENTSTVSPLRLGEVVVLDDGLGSNVLSLAGADAAFFELVGNTLFLKTGTVLDFETKSSYQVTLQVDDASLGATPDATAPFTLTVTDQDPETPPPPALLITEVAPWSSGNSPVGSDWFELTNNSTSEIDITGWRMDDSSKTFGSSVALNGITSIAPGESVIFLETSDLPGKSALFLTHWFGTNPPVGLQIGSYTGSGVGLGTSGDAVWLFDSVGQVRSGITFGASPGAASFGTFDNTAGLNGVAVSKLSAVGVDGALPAFASMAEIGSPGFAAPGLLRITEVAPWSSGNSPVGADWFEVTNVGSRVVSLEGWKMDDSSESPLGGAVALNGVSGVAPGESVIFLETETVATSVSGFLSAWFGANPPAGLQVGTYSGSGVGLSTGGDAVNLFDPANVRQAKVTFGASPAGAPFGTFDNSAVIDNGAISQFSVAGVNGAFVGVNSTIEIGSPGVTNRAPELGGAILTQAAANGSPFSLVVPGGIFIDLEGQPLTYSATRGDGSPLPAWLTFNGPALTFSGTPGALDAGNLVVKLIATDNGTPGRTSSTSFTVQVASAPIYTSLNIDVTTPNTGIWNPAGVNVNGTQFVNLGLQGVGRVPANSIDPATGESIGSVSDMQISGWKKNADGSFDGTFHFLPDRGYNSGAIYSNYAARLNDFTFTFTPYTGAAPTTLQNQIALNFAGSRRFTYDHDGNPATPSIFSTGLLATGKVTLFGTEIPAHAANTTQSDGTFANRLTVDAEGLILDSRPAKAGSGWVSDEYGPYIYHFNADGEIDGQLQLPAALVPYNPVGTTSFANSPANLSGRRENQGMEGIAQSPDGTKLFALLQSATLQDSATGAQNRYNTRLLVYDVSSSDTPGDPIAQYVIQLPRIDTVAPAGVDRTGAQSAILALNDHQILVLSRDGNGRGASGAPVFKSILLAELSGATNIDGTYDAEAAAVAPGAVLNALVTPLSWAEALNMLGKTDATTLELSKFNLNIDTAPGDVNSLSEKWEALSIVSANDAANPNDYFLFIGNDNDFSTQTGVYKDATGVNQSYDAGLENDTVVLAYRVRMTGPDNQAPFNGMTLTDQSATKGGAFSLQLPVGTFIDPEGQTLTYSATRGDGGPLPSWLTFNPGTRSFSGTPTAVDLGDLVVRVTATDGGTPALFTSTTFAISVAPSFGSPYFPLSVASGDPRETGVVLWTRLMDGDTAVNRSVTLHLSTTGSLAEVGTTGALGGANLWTGGTLTAQSAHDGVVKVKATGLDPDTTYYYQFTYNGQRSPIGRTKTAPAATSTRTVKYAAINCNDFVGRYFNVLKHLADNEAGNIDFVLNLGDYIYEATGDPSFQTSAPGRAMILSNPAEAINLGGGNYAAQSVGNYRDIYKTIRQDRQLQRVHELFPMISIWDDHEFSDDNWKDNATYFDDRVNEQQTSRKLNAEQVWMEFLPTERGLAGSNNGLEIDASDLFPNMTIYDAFNFGGNLDLILTDIRSERADHLIPEDSFPATVPMDETAVIATLAAANSLDVPTFTAGVWPGIRTNFAPYVNIDDAPYAAVKAGLLAIVGAGADASLATLPAGQVAATTGAGYATAKVTGFLDASFINSTFAAAGQPAPFDTAALSAMPRGLSFFLLGKTSFFSDFGSRYQVVDQTFQIYAGYMYQLFVGSGGALGRDQALFSSTQRSFLDTELSSSSAAGRTWRVVASSTPYTPIKFELGDLPDGLALPTQGTISGVTIPASIPSQFLVEFLLNADEPAGFPQYRKGIIDLLAQHDAIFVSGDIHAQLIGNNVATNGQKVVDFTVPSAASSQFRRAVSGAFASVEALMTPSVRAATGLTGNFTFDAVQKQAVIDATDEIIKRNTAEMVDADTSTHGYTVFTASPLAFDASFRKTDVANVDDNLYSQSVSGLDSFFQREEFRVSKTGSGPATDLALELPTPVTTSVAGNVGGSVSGGGNYLVGSNASFTATPNPGFVFAGWKVNGAPAGTTNPLVQTVTAGLVVEASFSYTLQLLHFADAEAGLLAPQTAPNLAALVDAFDGTYANTIILAGGDNYIPGPFAAAGTDAIVAATHNKGNNPFAADIEIHNRIGVQASTVGNHEFDFGTNAFSDAINDANFPYLTANLDFSGDSGISSRYQETVGVGGLEEASALTRKIVPSAVITVNGEKIGLVGATTQIIEGISSTGNVEVKGFTGDGAEANNMALLAGQLQPVINDLAGQGVNKIVLMAHLQQITLEQSLAPLLTGVDIVLAGGSNTRLGDSDDAAVAFPGHAADFAGTYPIVTAGADAKPVLIVNTDNEFTYLGRLIVDFDSNGEIVTSALPGRVSENGAYAATTANVAAAWGVAEGDFATTAFAPGTKGAGVKQITDAVQSVIAAKDGDVKGYTNFYLEGERNFVRNQETNLGNISADANAFVLAEAVGETIPIVSLKNGGGIRAAIGAVEVGSGAKNPPLPNPGAGKAAGGVSLLDIENSMRFNNLLMAFDTTAAGLKAILEHGVASLGGQGRFPQIGGVAFSYNPSLAAGSRVRSVALIDEDGATTHSVIESGSVSASAPSAIRLVTLNFLANGGDGYPMKANGENFRFLLTDGTLSAPLDEGLNFTVAGNIPANALGEQAAMSLYLTENFGTPDLAYNEPDTAPADDLRIQSLAVRADTVSDVTVTPSFTGSGSVSGGGVRALGTSAQFTATANAGSTFTGWIVNGAPAGTTNPLQVTVTVGMTVEATFVSHFTLQLLHLSDGEAGLLASQTAPNLAALVDAFDGTYANTLILSGGDNFIPGPFLNAGTDPSLNAVASVGRTNFARPDIAIHNLLGVEASAIGNHEWDLGSNVFIDAIRPDGAWAGAQFPHISTNLDYSLDSAANGRFTNVPLDGTTTAVPEASTLKSRLVPTAVITKNGEKIGLVGLTTQILRSISSPSGTFAKGFPEGTTGVNDMDLLATQVQPYIDELIAEGVNKIVLMSHLQQITNEQLLATKLRGVDIILAAGSNTRLGDSDDLAVAFPGHAANFVDTYPIVTAGTDGKPTAIVNTDNEYTYLGRLVIEFDGNGEIIVSEFANRTAINGAYAATAANAATAWGTTEANLAATAFAPGTKGALVKEVVDAVQGVINAKDGDVKGYTEVYLEGERNFVRSEETNFGNLSSDANAAALPALGDGVPVVSLKNGGGIRAQIGAIEVGSGAKLPPAANPGVGKLAGGISQLDIENALRFNNRLISFETTPQGLKNILEHGVAAGVLQGRFPQVGGVSFAWDPTRAAGDRITTISLIGEQGQLRDALYDGTFSPWAPAVIRLVTLNFLAGNSASPDGLGTGGDGYPMRANGSNFRFLLDDGTLGPILDPTLNFTAAPALPLNPLGEQQAFADFLIANYATPGNAYDVADTAAALDLRIQNLSRRSDAVPFDIDLTIDGSGVGSIGNEAIASGERQGIRFSLTEARRVEITGTGSTALRAELLDESGNIVGTFAGPGSILLAGNFPEGDYLLRVINESSSEEILSLNLEAGEVSVPRPDAAVGNSPGTLIGVDAYGPAASQELSLLSRKLGPVKAVVALANRSETDDSLRVEGSGGNRDFKVSYTLRGRNVTAQILAGRLTTAALSSDNAPVLIQSVITPDKQRLTRPGRTRPGVGVRGSAGLGNAGDRDKDRILRRTFISRVTATSSANPAVSDAVQIRVTTQ